MAQSDWLAPMLRFNQLEQIEFPIAEEVVAEMALEVADIELEAARKERKMGKVLEAAADVADEICDEVYIIDVIKRLLCWLRLYERVTIIR